MGQMADPPSKPRKLVHPVTRNAAVEPVLGKSIGGSPAASARRGEKRQPVAANARPVAANARSVQATGSRAGCAAPDTEHLTELPNLKMHQFAQVQPGLAARPSPLPETSGRLSRTARQLQRELGREATLEEIAEALGPGWNAARVEDAQSVCWETVSPEEPPDDGKDRA